jgi:zinc resistance-associated protein
MRLKTIVAGTIALVLAGASFAYAQQRQQNPGDFGAGAAERSQDGRDADWNNPARLPRDRFAGLSGEDRAAFLNARVAALRAGLQLTPEQEKSWPAFEAALRNLEAVRAGRMAARRDDQLPPNRIERLRREADALTSTGAGLRKLADAEEPLLNSLSDEQKRRFFFFTRFEHPMQFGDFARDFGGPGGPEEGRGPRDRFDGGHGLRDRDRPDRVLAERPDRPGPDWRARRDFGDPRGGDGRQDRRFPGATKGMDRYGDLDGDND